MTADASGDGTLRELVERARGGDRVALEGLVAAIQERVYGLALRMLWHPADAEDATQEILIRVVTNLESFRAESAFTTWVYRVASNYLLTTRKRRAERERLTFDIFAGQLAEGLSDGTIDVAGEVEERLLIEEVKLGCTQGMLLCLDREHRLAYILGEIFELPGPEGAAALDITPAAFRKRLSRARGQIERFMRGNCGLVNPANPCRCRRRVNHAVAIGRVDPERLLFAGHPAVEQPSGRVGELIEELNTARAAAHVLRSHPRYLAPDTFIGWLRDLLAIDTQPPAGGGRAD